MGCLPIIALFLLGTGVGWLVGDGAGALWGAAAGLGIGGVTTAALAALLRRARRG